MIGKNRILLMLFGIALVALAPFAGVSYVKPRRVLLKESVKVEYEKVVFLSFRVDRIRPGYLVRIFVNVTAVTVGPANYKPILDVVILDQQGLDLMENNQTVNYVYVKATDIQDPILLTANDIKQAGEYYIVFRNHFPTTANVPVTVADEWDEWNISKVFYLLVIIGLTVTVSGTIFERIARQIKVSSNR